MFLGKENKKMGRIKDKWLIVPFILLGLNLIYRLIDQSKIIFTFPLDSTNDMASYMAQLFFLVKCGFHKFCHYWYNGFVTFQTSPPGWYFFTLPIYWITKNVQISIYISMILIFILIFITVYYFGRLHKFSKLKRVAFFILLFGNAIAVGNFIRLMRVHELFGWLNFIIIAFTALWYKNKELDKKIYLIIIPLSLAILSHQYLAVLSFVVIFSLFIIKNEFKDKIKLSLISLISLVITSFWWIPFLLNFKKTIAPELLFSKKLFLFSGQWFWQNISTIIIPIVFCTLFYFYWISKNKSKKELLFFITPIAISVLLFSRLIYFIPILKHMYPDSLNHMFIFFSIFMLLKLDIWVIPKFLRKAIPIFLILIVLVSIGFNIFYTPFFVDHTNLEKNTLYILNRTTDRFVILGDDYTTSYKGAYYSYAAIYLDLPTAEGFYPHSIVMGYGEKLNLMETLFENRKCVELKQNLNYLNVTHIISYEEHCSWLKECGLKEKVRKNNVCLFSTI